MAYEQIYQITTKLLSSDSFITENDFIEHWLIGKIADFVAGCIDRNEEI
jgi:hypothetical protein